MRLYFSLFLLLICVACTAGDIIDFNSKNRNTGSDDIIGDISILNTKPSTPPISKADQSEGKTELVEASSINKGSAETAIPKKYKAVTLALKPVETIKVDYSENPTQKPSLQSIAPKKVAYKPSAYWHGATVDRKDKVRKKALNIPSKLKSKFAYNIGSYVAETNENIIEDRNKVRKIFHKQATGQGVSGSEKLWLKQKALDYKVSNFSINSAIKRQELQRKINIVPESLAIAQAAIESGWGKSRFAKEGNNYFGQWCYDKGCGIVPSKRAKYKSHEVKRFSSAKEAVEEYIHNLNTNQAYKNFRIARENMGVRITGTQLATHLTKYSAQGQTYIRKLKNIINYNKLD